MFEVGQKVVCINVDETPNYAPYGITLGKIYTITAIANCSCGCGTENLYLAEVPKKEKLCDARGAYTGVHSGYKSMRFKPLVETWIEELLEKIELEVAIEN